MFCMVMNCYAPGLRVWLSYLLKVVNNKNKSIIIQGDAVDFAFVLCITIC